MARHTDPDDTSFRRSLLRAAAGGLIAMVVTFAITAVLTQIGRDAPSQGPVVEFDDALTSGPSPSPVLPQPTAAETSRPTEPVVEPASEIARDMVTVQVLYAPGLDDLAGEVAAILRDLGYSVAAVNATDRTTDTTTILATAGREEAAEELRDADPRFGVIAENDGFSESVDLHILVGADFDAS
jgi:hypothetical protein